MADRLGALLAETANKASLEKEMSLARERPGVDDTRRVLMQEVGPFRVVGYCEPATDLRRRLVDLAAPVRRPLLIVVGDVTGHGIPSAMVAATARGAVEALAVVDERLLTPEHVLRAIDGAIRGSASRTLLMTCFAAVFDSQRGVVEYSNAGHNFPYLVAATATRCSTSPSWRCAAARSATSPATSCCNRARRQLAPGDVFVFFTDGVIDRVDGDGKRFGDRRLRRLLARQSAGRYGEGLAALATTSSPRCRRFAEGAPADDDITLVFVQYDPIAQARDASPARGARDEAARPRRRCSAGARRRRRARPRASRDLPPLPDDRRRRASPRPT